MTGKVQPFLKIKWSLLYLHFMQTRADSVIVGLAEDYSQGNFNEAWHLQIYWGIWFDTYLYLSYVSRAAISSFENHV